VGGDVEVLWDVGVRRGLVGVVDGARACRIHEMPHKRVSLGENEHRNYKMTIKKEHHVLGSAGSGSVQK